MVGMAQAQIYTIKVEPHEIDKLLDLKEPVQIPIVEIEGLSASEIDKLEAEDTLTDK
jgi:hypothetical protein